jgi:tRNA 5-methylaminomethyl-2-thiouridine biosynthesis bifunctional protein
VSSPFKPIQSADIDWRNNLPFSNVYKEYYFSAENGIKQSGYLFVAGNDLINRWQKIPLDSPTIFTVAETTFGPGLNFLLTWKIWEQYAPKTARLHYIACEKHPLKINDLKRCLDFWPELSNQAMQLIDNYPILTPGYHQLSFGDGRVTLTLMLGDALECFEQLLVCGESQLEAKLRSIFVDAWYLNGFPHEKHENHRSHSLLKIIAMLSKEGSSLATYMDSESVEEIVRDAGFIIDQKEIYGSKQEFMTAYFNQSAPCKLRTRDTPWNIGHPTIYQDKSAIIIGAGLAGAFTAHSLARRGWKVTVFDELDEAGKGGSANQQAVLFPRLSAYKSPLTQFMLSAFIYASQMYKSLVHQFALGELKGSLLLAHNEKEYKAQRSLENWLFHYPELGALVDKTSASELSGLALDKPGLYIPLSGWINSPALCRVLLNNDRISLLTGYTVNSLDFKKDNWMVQNVKAPVLILANGSKVNVFNETQHLPVKSIRGQMTAIQATSNSGKLLIPICAEGHILPEVNGIHYLGATYEPTEFASVVRDSDDEININKLDQIANGKVWSKKAVDHWAGIRASTPDYLPLVGQLPIADKFLASFSGLESNSKRWMAKEGPYYRGLYACAGFGSRGLTTIPLCAEWLAASINNEMDCLPRNLIHALSPARFLRRSIIRGLY